MRVALVHDFLLDVRGAERVFEVMCDMWPDADVYTAVYDEQGTEGRFSDRRVRTSFLQRLRPTARTFRGLLPFYPRAMEALDLSSYGLVVSSSSAWAHGVVPDEGAVHVCYCHNPFRYAWNAYEDTVTRFPAVGRAPLAAVLARWRKWDWSAARRVSAYVANSQTTALRLQRYWDRAAPVVYPPVNTRRFAPSGGPVSPVGDYHVVLSELVEHKRIDVAVRAFGLLGLPLVVVGDGPDLRRLRSLAGPTVRFAGRVSDAQVVSLVSRARALVVTATEEFGIAAIEAQAAGRPVVALAEGGVRETMIEGRTGVFYDRPDPVALAEAVHACEARAIDPADCRTNAARFDETRFRAGLAAEVERACAKGS